MGFYNVCQSHDVDHLYKSACFSEANWLRGTECLFYSCIGSQRDLESDYHAKLWDPIRINVVLEDYTKAELEKMNWMAESDELPFHAYVSNIIWPEFLKARREYIKEGGNFKEYFRSCFNDHSELLTYQPWYLRVTKFSILEFPYVMEVAGTQKLRVMKVMGDQTNPFIWDCQLAPHRSQIDLIPSTGNIDPVTTYDKNAQVIGKAYTKQKNKHEKDTDIHPDPEHPEIDPFNPENWDTDFDPFPPETGDLTPPQPPVEVKPKPPVMEEPFDPLDPNMGIKPKPPDDEFIPLEPDVDNKPERPDDEFIPLEPDVDNKPEKPDDEFIPLDPDDDSNQKPQKPDEEFVPLNPDVDNKPEKPEEPDEPFEELGPDEYEKPDKPESPEEEDAPDDPTNPYLNMYPK